MIEIVPLEPSDYDAVMALWRATEGLTLRDADSRDGLTRYLERNPGLSFVVRAENQIVGAVLGGHDGRRGYLHHLAVAPAYRGKGVGRALAQRVLAALVAGGLTKCHLFVRADNATARAFWAHLGWAERDDLTLMSHTAADAANA
ncbi:MAG TPA: GNAT family N-acetyltransferase [Gemmataceae bacterium]|nr:GNAT family N-acetyltransferase [Gemmataceae bacterium]